MTVLLTHLIIITWALQLKISQKYNISRQEADIFALESQHKAENAIKNNKFKDEIIPVGNKSWKKYQNFR